MRNALNQSITLLLILSLTASIAVPVIGLAAAQTNNETNTTQTKEAGESSVLNTSNTTTTTPTETPTPNETEAVTPTLTPEPTPTPTETPVSDSRSDGNVSVLVEIDSNTRILDSSWDDGTVTYLVERDPGSDRDTLVTTDASIRLQDYEARSIPQQRQRIGPGTHEVTFTVERSSSAAVTVGTSRGLVSLSPGDGLGWFSRAAAWVDVRVAAVFALLGVPAMAIGVWATVASKSVDVEAVDLDQGRGGGGGNGD